MNSISVNIAMIPSHGLQLQVVLVNNDLNAVTLCCILHHNGIKFETLSKCTPSALHFYPALNAVAS